MPKQTEIAIFPIAKTQINVNEVDKWLKFLGADEFDNNLLIDDVSDPALLIALAAKRCYMSFEVGLNKNITQVRKNYVDYFDNLLKSKHGSVFEHACYSFAIEGVSRIFTAEMNRHRAGWAISEGSLRFIRFDKDIKYWSPKSWQIDYNNDDLELQSKKALSNAILKDVFSYVETAYSLLMQTWEMDKEGASFAYKKKYTSAARRIVPMGVATGGVWSGNIRALRHVIAMRTDPAAEEEIFEVFGKVASFIIENEPLLFKDFHKNENNSWKPDNWKI